VGNSQSNTLATTSLKAASLLILAGNKQSNIQATSAKKTGQHPTQKMGVDVALFERDSESGLCAELEQLILIVGAAYNTPPDEYPIIRQTAAKDPAAALRSYRLMALEIEQEAHHSIADTGGEQSPMPEPVSCHGCLHHDFDTTPGKFNPICKIHAALPFVRWHAGINVLARDCHKKQDRPKTVKTV
jgi:hypothetical protein